MDTIELDAIANNRFHTSSIRAHPLKLLTNYVMMFVLGKPEIVES